MSVQSTFPRRKPPLTLLHGQFSLTEHAPFVRLRRRKTPTSPVFTKRCFRFAMLNLPESISQSAQLSTISLVSLASFLPAPSSDYSGGKPATIPARSLLLFPNCFQMTYFCVFPTSDLKAKLNPKTESSSHAHLYHKTSKQKTDFSIALAAIYTRRKTSIP